MSRIFALSDIHVDITENMAWVLGLSRGDYGRDALLVAGDVSHDLSRMEAAFSHLQATFARVFFVPGNHDLWLRSPNGKTAIDKLSEVLDLCQRLGVEAEPGRIHTAVGAVWILPVFSWYRMPEEGPASLYAQKPGEDPTLSMWSDRRFVRWPDLAPHVCAADYMLSLNNGRSDAAYDAPVISFSHFLPRTDLIFSTDGERKAQPHPRDPFPAFNFSRVAGCACIEHHIRAAGSRVHLYGHQHRDRCRHIDGVTYVSRCLGYPRERRSRGIGPLDAGPKLIWDNGLALSPD